MLSDKQRKNIVRVCKKQNIWWTGNETDQDKLIEKECLKRGYTIHHFYATDGEFLSKILS